MSLGDNCGTSLERTAGKSPSSPNHSVWALYSGVCSQLTRTHLRIAVLDVPRPELGLYSRPSTAPPIRTAGGNMARLPFIALALLICLGVLLLTGFAGDAAFWSQWGRNPQHTGMVSIPAQPLDNKLADIIYDPFAGQEQAENQPVYGEG